MIYIQIIEVLAYIHKNEILQWHKNIFIYRKMANSKIEKLETTKNHTDGFHISAFKSLLFKKLNKIVTQSGYR